jgi:hypothetical protein
MADHDNMGTEWTSGHTRIQKGRRKSWRHGATRPSIIENFSCSCFDFGERFVEHGFDDVEGDLAKIRIYQLQNQLAAPLGMGKCLSR